MTLKQVLIRYLKDIGYYGMLYRYMLYCYCNGRYITCNKMLTNCGPNELFWYIGKMSDSLHVRWAYRNRTLYEFVSDWCEPIIDIGKGDIVTAVTQDGKYEFTYRVRDVWLSTFELELEGGQRLSISRISKVNGKDCNFTKGWKFRKEVIR